MHHNNMPAGSGLWHFLYRLERKFIQWLVSSEKEVATTSRNRNRKTFIMMYFGNEYSVSWLVQ